MTTARLVEHQIIRNALRRRESATGSCPSVPAERIISILAVTAAMLLLGSYLQELLWVLLAGAGALTLGTRTG